MEFDPKGMLLLVLVFVVVMVVLLKPSKRGALPRTCRQCGAAHPAFARFCRRCGGRL